MPVDEATALYDEHDEKTFCFCSYFCRHEFLPHCNNSLLWICWPSRHFIRTSLSQSKAAEVLFLCNTERAQLISGWRKISWTASLPTARGRPCRDVGKLQACAKNTSCVRHVSTGQMYPLFCGNQRLRCRLSSRSACSQSSNS